MNTPRSLEFLSQAAVAEFFGLSRRRIQQLEERALAKLKAAIEREAEKQGKTVGEWIKEAI